MWTRDKGAVAGEPIPWCRKRDKVAAFGGPVAARGKPDDFFSCAHRQSETASGSDSTRSSAISTGPANSAARPCSQTPAQAASKEARPPARIAAIIPVRTSPVPAVANQWEVEEEIAARPSGSATTVSAPLYTIIDPATAAAWRALSILLPLQSGKRRQNSPPWGVRMGTSERSRRTPIASAARRVRASASNTKGMSVLKARSSRACAPLPFPKPGPTAKAPIRRSSRTVAGTSSLWTMARGIRVC